MLGKHRRGVWYYGRHPNLQPFDLSLSSLFLLSFLHYTYPVLKLSYTCVCLCALCLSHQRVSSMGLGLYLSHFGSLELAQGSAGVPRPGNHLSEPPSLTCGRKTTAVPARAAERVEGGEALPGLCEASEGTAVTSWFLELSTKSWPRLLVSSPASAPGIGTWPPAA